MAYSASCFAELPPSSMKAQLSVPGLFSIAFLFLTFNLFLTFSLYYLLVEQGGPAL